jgi:predicted nuclease of restriction endonuclease-like (RecB) superfamily
MTDVNLTQDYQSFIEDIKTRILSSRYQAARAVNKELILLYHHIGTQILEKQKTQGWGAKVIEHLSKDLKMAFPDLKGFGVANLFYMRRFAETYPIDSILQPLVVELPWSHHLLLMNKTKTEKERLFYLESAVANGWSKSTLLYKIDLNLFERQGMAIHNFDELLPTVQAKLAHETLKDPYLFHFLEIFDEVNEREIEKGLVKHIEKFLLELGEGFAFVGRQYRLTFRNKDFVLDLLFYHLKLRCYVVIELKDTEFSAHHTGQLNFYLSAVDDLLRHPQDNPTIGILLCRSKDNFFVEYALRNLNSPIGVAEYRLTESLPADIKTALPSVEQIEFELSKHLNSEVHPSQDNDQSTTEDE